MKNARIGFIGAGNMAGALIGALASAGQGAPRRITAYDVDSAKISDLAGRWGAVSASGVWEVFQESDVVVLAVKPQVLPNVLRALAGSPGFPGKDRKLIVSIAAGVTIQGMEDVLYAGLDEPAKARTPIIRVMPNTPALVGQGMAGMAKNAHASEEDCRLAEAVMAAAGKARWFEEKDINAVTAVSGSGPAYVFYLAEAMIQGGVECGLSQEDAQALTIQTIRGAAALMEQTGEGPAELRRKVTSPGGTTAAAISVFDAQGVNKALVDGVNAAKKRGEELAG